LLRFLQENSYSRSSCVPAARLVKSIALCNRAVSPRRLAAALLRHADRSDDRRDRACPALAGMLGQRTMIEDATLLANETATPIADSRSRLHHELAPEESYSRLFTDQVAEGKIQFVVSGLPHA
jgi:hypothetical protein